MKVGYVVLYEDGELVISKKHTVLQKKIEKDYGEFEYINIPWKNDKKKIKQVRILNQIKSNYMRSWFEDCYNLTTLIDFQNLDVSDCEDFKFTFYCCKSLTDVSSLKDWDVSNGRDFLFMFENCTSLQDISALANWNVVNGEDFESMFDYCVLLTNVFVLENWNMSNGEDFNWIFSGCINLKEIYLPDTLKCLNYLMFEGCDFNLKIHWKNKIYTYEDVFKYEIILDEGV